MNASRKSYEPPAVIYETALEVRAGTPQYRKGSVFNTPDLPIRDAVLGRKWDRDDRRYGHK